MTTTIETSGSTSLSQVANIYALGASGVQVKRGGVAVVTGEFGAWTPLGAEQAGSGDKVVWQFGSADQYVGGNVASDGNWLSQAR